MALILLTESGGGSAYGNRTRLSALRGPCPEPIDERAWTSRKLPDPVPGLKFKVEGGRAAVLRSPAPRQRRPTDGW